MRVLLLLTYYHPHRTGLTRHAQYVAEALVQRGHQVTVLSAKFLPDLAEEETLNGVRVVRLPSALRLSRGQVTPGYPAAVSRLVDECDVVSIHTPMLETALATFIAKRKGKAVYITHHGDLVLPAGLTNRAIEGVMSRLFHTAAGMADGLIAYSDDYLEHSSYLKPHAGKTTVVYPPVQLVAPSRGARTALRKKLGVGSAPLIGYSGRFVEEKRPDILIRALQHLDRTAPGAHVAFAGEHEVGYEDYFQRQAPLVARYRDRLHFLGLLTDDQELADFYAGCDVLALPSATETFALVQVEAMLSGTPVVATDIPGAREVVRVTGMGKLARPRDSLSLAQALAEVLQDRKRYLRPRAEIAEIFSFERTIDSYEALFSEGAKRSSGG